MVRAGLLITGILFLVSACVTADRTPSPTGASLRAPVLEEVPAGIPQQYIPRPGHCRVWHPGRSPEEQPAPERCLEIQEIPPGTWLVYGGSRIRTYRIEEYDAHRTGTVNRVNYFELESGRFLRQEQICR